MNIDQFLINLDKIYIKSLTSSSEEESIILLALSSGNIGYFKWDFSNKVIYFSEMMFTICGIKKSFDGSVLTLMQMLFNNDVFFKFMSQLMTIQETKSKANIDIDIFSAYHQENRYIRLTYDYYEDRDIIMGTVQDIHELKLAKVEAIEVNDSLTQILSGIPLPIYYYDHVGNLIFNNELIDWPMAHLNHMVEKHINGLTSELENSKEIIGFEVKFFKTNHRKYKLKVKHNYNMIVIMLHRIQIKRNDDAVGILFVHEDITENFEEENKILKVLKTNELTIKIKDIVDQNVDLQILFDYVLKHISSVIPSVKRTCILKVDHENNMYMAADFGYDESYTKALSIPFEKTFAYTWLKGDYSKSIIINDIQEKLIQAYPDLNKNQNGFVMGSNMTSPILIDNKLYGLLSVDSDVNNVFDSVDLNLIDYIRIQLERSIAKHNLLNKYKTESISDPLTGAYNRRHLVEVFESMLIKGESEAKNFALAIFDMDDLKTVNDTYGHLVGDAMLKIFSMKVLKGSRSDDILARYGGDEFVGLFWDISLKDLLSKIETVQNNLSNELVISSNPNLHVSFSFGISIYPGDGSSFNKLLDAADQRMYVQKNAKKER